MQHEPLGYLARPARVGVDHAMAAQNWANDTDDGLLRAYTADVAARAYAGLGNQQACFEALDTARAGVADTTPQTPGTSLAYFYGPGQLAQTRSLCLLQLGDTVQAEQAARESLNLVGSSFVRNQAFWPLPGQRLPGGRGAGAGHTDRW